MGGHSEARRLYRTLQTSTGGFLTGFTFSHLNAVFNLGRAVTKVDTTFPVGFRNSGSSSARRVERAAYSHYPLGVWFVISHMELGFRAVLLAHGVSPLAAARVAWIVALGAAFALMTTVAQLQVHGAS
jgi:hypothetical protein